VAYSAGTKISLLPQEVPQNLHGRAIDIVTSGSKQAEHEGLWQIEQRAAHLLSGMGLPVVKTNRNRVRFSRIVNRPSDRPGRLYITYTFSSRGRYPDTSKAATA
jgi:hypothetical protein